MRGRSASLAEPRGVDGRRPAVRSGQGPLIGRRPAVRSGQRPPIGHHPAVGTGPRLPIGRRPAALTKRRPPHGTRGAVSPLQRRAIGCRPAALPMQRRAIGGPPGSGSAAAVSSGRRWPVCRRTIARAAADRPDVGRKSRKRPPIGRMSADNRANGGPAGFLVKPGRTPARWPRQGEKAGRARPGRPRSIIRAGASRVRRRRCRSGPRGASRRRLPLVPVSRRPGLCGPCQPPSSRSFRSASSICFIKANF